MFGTRRNFIASGALAAGYFTAPRIFADAMPGRLNGLPTVAMIGMGKQGRHLMNQFLDRKVVVTRVCDCDRVRREDGVARARKFYADHPDRGVPADACTGEADFRKILEDPGVDMVCIATPDHWHAHMVVEAMKHGKDVYCEKPLTYTVDEARTIVEVVKRTGRILQVGAMQRSSDEFRAACEMVRNGIVGDVKYVECQFGGPSCPRRPYKDFRNFEKEGAPNPDVDWKMWLGPAPDAPYSDQLSPRGVHDYFPMFWREDDHFGSGMCGDWGAHHLDIAAWGMDKDGTGPVKVVAGNEPRHWAWDRGYRRQWGTKLVYADGLVVRHVQGTSWGCVFYGSKGAVCVDRGRFALWSGERGWDVDAKLRGALSDGSFDGLTKIAYYNGTQSRRVDGVEKRIDTASDEFGKNAGDAVKIAERKLGFKTADFKTKLYESHNQVANFVDCVASRRRAISNEDVGPWSSVLCQLMNMSYVHDTGFDWDPAAMAFAGGTGNRDWLSRLEMRPATGRFETKA